MKGGRARGLALAGVLVAVPLVMADACNEERDTVNIHKVFMDVSVTRSADRAVKDAVSTQPGKDLAQGDFAVAAGVPGTLVVEFGSATSYSECVLDLDGQSTLKVYGTPGGNYQVRRPSDALAAGRTVSASITCSPDTWFSPRATTTFSVSTEATGQLVPSPEAIDFGNVPVGTTSAPRTVTYRNVGKTAVRVGAPVSGYGLATNFVIDSDTCKGASVAPGGDCKVTLRARPAYSGSFESELDLVSSALVPTRVVRLTGTSGSGPALSVSATTVDFGGVEVGSSANRSVTVSNSGGGSFRIDRVTIEQSDQFAITSDACAGRTLNAGGTCEVQMRFSPTVSGYATGRLLLRDNAPGDSHSVTLTGIGNAPAPVTTGGYPSPP